MSEFRRILAGPLRLTGRLSPTQRALLVAADVLARRAGASGRDVDVHVAVLTGSVAGQVALERQLAREGFDRATLGRSAFVERVRHHEGELRAGATVEASDLGVSLDVGAATTDDPNVQRAARIAFVRLYEAGLLELAERVVATCVRCETVLDSADVEIGEVEGERLVVRVAAGDAALDVEVESPELLGASVAVGVPLGHDLAGAVARLPVAELDVPVVADPDIERPRLLIPGHDESDLDVARRHGLFPVVALDEEGCVQLPGPLHGLSRFAARSTARALLDQASLVVSAEAATVRAERCRRCGTLLVPRLGRHWFLRTADLELAVADAIREGDLVVTPADARQALLDRAGRGESWCVSSQVWAGAPVPVATCGDCGRTAVEVEPASSCNKCMGGLEADGSALDARFVGTIWALASAGWPDDERNVAEAGVETLLLTSEAGLSIWALPMAALGLRLAGALPFAHVAVQPVGNDDGDAPAGRVARLLALSPAIADAHTAEQVLAVLRDPPEGEGDIDSVLPLYEGSLDAGLPGSALDVVASLAQTGVPPSAADRVRALAAPLLGE